MIRSLALAAVSATAVLALSSCGQQQADPLPSSSHSSSSEESSEIPDFLAALANDGFDCDLTQLNSNMMYGQIFDMVSNPDRYTDMTVRVTGNFNYYKDGAGKEYFSVFIPDAAQCCKQGIEFVLNGEHKYPDDYPADGEEITVTGVLNAYDEYHVTYLQLLDAEIVPLVKMGGTTNESIN